MHEKGYFILQEISQFSRVFQFLKEGEMRASARVICSINALRYNANKRIPTRCNKLKIMHRKYITRYDPKSYSFPFLRFRIDELIGKSLCNGRIRLRLIGDSKETIRRYKVSLYESIRLVSRDAILLDHLLGIPLSTLYFYALDLLPRPTSFQFRNFHPLLYDSPPRKRRFTHVLESTKLSLCTNGSEV